mgnify:CR=1 FL=1
MHKRAERLTVLTDIFSPCGRRLGNMPDITLFLSRQKSVPLKLRAPKTDCFCRDSLRTTQEYRAYFKEDETKYRQKNRFRRQASVLLCINIKLAHILSYSVKILDKFAVSRISHLPVKSILCRLYYILITVSPVGILTDIFQVRR